MSSDAAGLLFELWRISRAGHRQLIREEAPDTDATGLLFELRRILRASHRELIREEAPDAERAQALTAPRLAAWARGTVTQGHAYRVQRASIRSASIRGFTSELDRDLDMDHRDLDRVRGAIRMRIGRRFIATWIACAGPCQQ